MAGRLKQFRSVLRENLDFTDSSWVPGNFQVIGIYCYIADQTYLKSISSTLHRGKETVYLYDILITDNAEKLKCLLALPLGSLVQQHILKVGSIIQANSARLCYLDGEAHVVTYVLLEDIVIVEDRAVQVQSIDSIPFVPSDNRRETELTPLVTGRIYYLNQWTTNIPYGPAWENTDSLENYDNDAPTPAFQTIKQMADEWKSLPRPYFPLLVVVLYRGKLHHFGNSQTDRPCPFMGYLEFADSSASCAAVVWSRLNFGLYHSAVPGKILVIENYLVRERSQNSTHCPALRGKAKDNGRVDMEIKINEFTKIKFASDADTSIAQQITSLPKVEYSFVKRASLHFVPADTLVDVVGLVTYAGYYQRQKPRSLGSANALYGGFFTYHWIQMIDSSSFLPFKVLLYISREKSVHDNIHPGQVLVCTQLRVSYVPPEINTDRITSVYLVSSVYTEIYDRHSQDKQYMKHQAVLEVADIFRRRDQEISFFRSNVLRIGGKHMFPPCYKTYEQYKANYSSEFPSKFLMNIFVDGVIKPSSIDSPVIIPTPDVNNVLHLVLKLTPGASWATTVSSMAYRESLRLTLGGFIVHVEYIDLATEESTTAHGWTYSKTIKSRRTLFFNVKVANKLSGMQSLTSASNHLRIFPRQYIAEHEEDLKNSKLFPASTADCWKPSTEENLESIPVLCDGYYIISLASLHFQALLKCVLIPEPSEQPHPSFIELLSGNFKSRFTKNTKTFLSEPPRYTWDEVKKIQLTAPAISNRSFVCIVDLYCPKTGSVDAVLQRAFLCPPDVEAATISADLQT